MTRDETPRPPKVFYSTLRTILVRSLSFVGTQYCIRLFTSPIVLGTNVQLELMMIFILLVSREGFRLAISSNSHSSSESHDDPLGGGGSGVAFLTVPLTLLFTMIALMGHSYHCIKERDTDYQWAGILYCLAAFVEGCAEPVVLFFLQFVSIAEKATAEGISAMMKTMSTVAILQMFQSDILLERYPITVLGVSQLIYAITYTAFLYGTVWNRGQLRSVLPAWHTKPSSSWTRNLQMYQPKLQLIGLFTLQSMLKFLLTEGDRILLSLLAGRYDQGVYALGNAYGGLAARLLLQPIEETARLLFRQQSTQDDPLLSQQRSYIVAVKTVLYVGLIFCCLAVNYTYILLNLLAGRYWGSHTEAVAVLSGFCVYTAFLAGNGMTEAFVYGVANTALDIGRLSVAHTVSGVGFALLAPMAVTQYGTLGLVAANCLTMFIRTAFSVYYAARYFGQQQGTSTTQIMKQLLRSMIPHPSILLFFMFAFFGTQASLQRILSRIKVDELEPMSVPWLRLAMEHIGVGVAFGIGMLSFAYIVERDFQRNIRAMWHEKKD
jgi:oligosaccharide translocation protein RFT1